MFYHFPFFSFNNVCIRFLSVSSPSYGTLFNFLLSLFNVFFIFFNLPLPVRLLSHFLICVFSILCLFYFFVKIFPRPFAELSPVIVLFFFVCYVCVFVCFVFTVSTSSMALFAQHQSLLFFILLLLACMCVCE